jgi:hypothetical protein
VKGINIAVGQYKAEVRVLKYGLNISAARASGANPVWTDRYLFNSEPNLALIPLTSPQFSTLDFLLSCAPSFWRVGINRRPVFCVNKNVLYLDASDFLRVYRRWLLTSAGALGPFTYYVTPLGGRGS